VSSPTIPTVRTSSVVHNTLSCRRRPPLSQGMIIWATFLMQQVSYHMYLKSHLSAILQLASSSRIPFLARATETSPVMSANKISSSRQRCERTAKQGVSLRFSMNSRGISCKGPSWSVLSRRMCRGHIVVKRLLRRRIEERKRATAG
jgi:hypothetical protein